jgi:ribosome biogenesis GTPase A
MPITWFPGHMLTARDKAAEAMGRTDLVIEVLDARVPLASCNPLFERLRRAGKRPALKLLNKSDVADPEQTRLWLNHYNAQAGVQGIALSAKKAGELGRVLPACRALRPDRGTPDRPLRMMILGIPNVGKSTLMNALLKRRVARVGDEPAITKVQMFHELGPGLSLIDTPGMLWQGMAQETAYKLAATHSIGRAAYDDEDVALTLGRQLLAHYPALLAQRFGALPAGCDGHGLLAAIAAGRGLVKKAGAPDTARAATALLNDFRSGALGRITLERPPAVASEG